METATKPQQVELDKEMVRKMAKALWALEFVERSPNASPEDRKASWTAEKRGAIARSKKLLRRLSADGVTLAARD